MTLLIGKLLSRESKTKKKKSFFHQSSHPQTHTYTNHAHDFYRKSHIYIYIYLLKKKKKHIIMIIKE